MLATSEVNSGHPATIGPEVQGNSVFGRIDRDLAFTAQSTRRVGQSGEDAELGAFQASDTASYCTGSEFVIDGGSLAETVLGIE